MTERIYTKEEAERELRKSQADALIWSTFLNVMERGDVVMIDEIAGKEPRFRIVKLKKGKH